MNFIETYRSLLEKYEWESYKDKSFGGRYKELVRVVAEVMVLPSEALINISGEAIPQYMVASVYEELNSECLEQVARKFARLPYKVKTVKTYLRSMLYNSVFEIENSIVNEVTSDEAQKIGFI